MRAGRVPHAIGGGKATQKGRILSALTKLNDRDTQKTAADDLLRMVADMDQEGLPLLISCLCGTGSEQKVYARKECARALGKLASQVNPVRDQALQPPYLARILGQLKKSLQDPDSTVRDAGSEALALVACGLADAGGPHTAAPAVRVIFDGLGEQKKEVQVAACSALGQAAPFIGHLDTAQIKEVIKKLGSSSFHGHAALLAALGRCDVSTCEPQGLVKSSPGAFHPVLHTLIGHPASLSPSSAPASGVPPGAFGAGILASFASKDWQARRAAADCIKALVLVMGPLLEVEGVWAPADPASLTGRCARGLETCRHDKVKDVRDLARETLQVLDVLQQYGDAGGDSGGWAMHAREVLVARGIMAPAALQPEPSAARLQPASPRRAPSPPPAARALSSPTAQRISPSRERSSAFDKQSSLNARFRKAHKGDGDVVNDPYTRGDRPDSQEEASRALQHNGSSGRSRKDGATAEPEVRPPAMLSSTNRQDSLNASRCVGSETILAQAAAEAAAAAATSGTGLQGAAVEPQVDEDLLLERMPAVDTTSLEASLAPSMWRRAKNQLRSTAARITKAVDAPTSPTPLPPPTPAPQGAASPPLHAATAHSPALGGPAPVSMAEWRGLQQQLKAMAEQQQQLLDALANERDHSTKTIASLQARILGLEAAQSVRNSGSGVAVVPAGAWGSGGGSAAEVPSTSLLAPAAPTQLTFHSPYPLSGGVQRMMPHSQAAIATMAAQPALPAHLMRDLRPQPAGHARPSGLDVATPSWLSPRPNSATNAQPATPTSTTPPTPGTTPVPTTPLSLNAAYSEALSNGRRGDMHLLRLVQRTGPVWNDLAYSTAMSLLAVFVQFVQEGTFLPKIVPWLTRLGDDHATQLVLPREVQLQLVSALAGSGAANSLPVDEQERVNRLLKTLQSSWGVSAGETAQAVSSSIHPAGVPVLAWGDDASAPGAHDSPSGQFASPVSFSGADVVMDVESEKHSRQLLQLGLAPELSRCAPTSPPLVAPAARPIASPGMMAKSSPYNRHSLDNLDQLRGTLDRLQRDFDASSPRY